MTESADSVFAWPPARENPHLVGHEAAARTLVEAWGSGRLAHAWLIAGPRGIGKATLAFRFARFALGGGEGGGDDGLTMAPEHPVFRRIAAGGHSDLAVIERGLGDRGGSAPRLWWTTCGAANAFLSLTAGEGGWRVVIVDAADEMNRNAANALLKRLEEPPSRVLFLLVSHAPSRVPATLRSRCRMLSLAPLPAPALDGLLAEAMPGLPAAERRVLGLLAEGSPGRAAALAEQGGVALYRRLIGLVGTLPALDARPLHELADGVSGRDGVDRMRTLAELILWWLGRSIRAAARGELETMEEVVPGEKASAALLRGAALDRWVGVWENLGRSFADADGLNLDPRQVLIGAFSGAAGGRAGLSGRAAGPEVSAWRPERPTT